MWVNLPAKEGFTALHFASFKGHLDSINSLLQAGANFHALTATKLNMMHVAAQNDQAASLYIFKELGLDIDAEDHKGATAVDWAVHKGMEVALSYLLAWGPDLEHQD
jgi:ankyrin repeat protein